MMQIVEYIVEHSVWFLSGAILILLAIIGYYAEKNNFGLGKNVEIDSDEKTELKNDLEMKNFVNNDQRQTVLNDYNKYSDKNVDSNQQSLSSEQVDTNDMQSMEEFGIPTTLSTSSMDASQINEIDESKTEPNLVELSPILPTTVKEENENLLNEESINKFNEEFDSILPKKSLIDTDLLDDIDDLELGKTQKFNLSDLSDFGDIELPKIKSLETEEHDIWKF